MSRLFKMASSKSPLMAPIALSNNLTMPSLHLGVYLMTSSEASTAVSQALQTGYRAFDSAQMYHNERAVGSSILSFLAANPDVKREEIHYTTKLASNDGYEKARKSIKQSVKECGLGYIDLFLIHSPYGGKRLRLESWRAVEDAIEEGEVRIGGVSNYGEKHVSLNRSKWRI
jgi:diketogulonate reductase-like aldo/keto reductase